MREGVYVLCLSESMGWGGERGLGGLRVCALVHLRTLRYVCHWPRQLCCKVQLDVLLK